MIWKTHGDASLPTVILLHGGGLSDWSLQGVVSLLLPRYHVVTPVLDGHGEDGEKTFLSIGDCADKVLRYIDQRHGGHVFAIGGLSIGAQICTEVLSRRMDVTDCAVLESALVCPIPGTAALTAPTYKACYGLIKKRWFAKAQAKTLCVPPELFERYYQDSLRISCQSLIHMALSNGTYTLSSDIAHTKARVLILAGSKEIGMIKKSAALLHSTIPGSTLYLAQGLRHGELSLKFPEQYAALLLGFFVGDTRETEPTAL